MPISPFLSFSPILLLFSHFFSSLHIKLMICFSIKVRVILECVIHTESSADKEPEPTNSTPQFIASSNFRMLRGLPPPSPSLTRQSLRSLRNSAPPGTTPIRTSTSIAPPQSPQQTTPPPQQRELPPPSPPSSSPVSCSRPRSTTSVSSTSFLFVFVTLLTL